MCMQAHGDKGHLSIALTGEDLTQLSSQCMQDTELVYTKGKAQDHKAMLLVAMPACSAATAGEHHNLLGVPHILSSGADKCQKWALYNISGPMSPLRSVCMMKYRWY